ncbi:MAG: glutathione S-transferase family protein, partial [Rhodospirillaceae bacterium]|nr:glutathione S-transferase family protein [Rhodospirillaceae bacterium]
MYKLYWSAGSAAMAPQAIVLESGARAEFIHLDDEKREHKSADYLKLNPHGRVPTLVFDDNQVMYESAAICQFLVERHPELKLAPAVGSPDRARYLQWMAYLTNTVQEAIMHWWHGENFIDGEAEQAKLKAKSEERLAGMWTFLDNEIATRGPHLCGEPFYACDYFLVMLIRWSRKMAKPGHTYPHLSALIRETIRRPAYAKMLAMQGIDQAV